MSKTFELRFVDLALEDRVLHTLTEVFAGGGNVTKASPPGFRLSVDIVGNEDVHSYLGVKGT